MPSYYNTLPDIGQTVSRPAIFAVVNQLIELTRLSPDTKILYKGDADSIQTPGTSIDDSSRDAKFSTSHYTFIEVIESYQHGSMQEIMTYAHEHPSSFQDLDLRLWLKPIYATSDVSIQIRYRSPSKTEVERWMAEMNIKTGRGRDINLHTISYTYPLPLPFVALIEDIWTLREKNHGYGEDFQTYLKSHCSSRMTLLSNQAGEMRQLAIKETQAGIQGLFDFAGVPDAPTKNNATGTWEIAFTYKFTYNRPDAMYVQYPLMVHQQFIPEKYFAGMFQEDDPISRPHYYSRSYEALARFGSGNGHNDIRGVDPYIFIPTFDDFRLKSVQPGTSTIFTALCFLEEDNQTLLDLKSLGSYVIDPDVISFMKKEQGLMAKLFFSLFYISIYENEIRLPDEQVSISSQLVISSTKILNPRKVYHVRLSALTDIQSGQWSSIERLSTFPAAFTKVLAALNELLAINPDFKDLNRKRTIEKWEMTYAYWVLTGGKNPVASGPKFGANGVPIPGGAGSYIWNDVANNPTTNGNSGKRFFPDIDQSVLDDYFRSKRMTGMTVQLSYIIAASDSQLK